jgi:hypothetical protein
MVKKTFKNPKTIPSAVNNPDGGYFGILFYCKVLGLKKVNW